MIFTFNLLTLFCPKLHNHQQLIQTNSSYHLFCVTKRSQKWVFTIFDLVETLTVSTSKCSQFIFLPRCTNVVNMVKFCQAVYGGLSEQTFSKQMHARTDGEPENIMPPSI